MNQDKKSKLIRTAQIALACFIVFDLIVHFKVMTKSTNESFPEVMVHKPQMRQVVDFMTQTGNTVAFNSVDLVARVQGYLDDITFVDGSFIKKGQPLFVIEPAPYLAKVRAAKASLTALRAANDYANAEYARQKRMYKENATSLNNVEKWLASSHESAAEVDKSLADLELAEINYSYTHIQAPFDGRIGRHLVDKGNLVGNGVATNLATIEQLDPIYVYFNLNELDYLRLRDAARAKNKDEQTIKEIPVYVGFQNENGFSFEGKLDFVNTSLDASTGTMEVRALLPNKKRLLVPNLFVQVRVPLSKPQSHLTVPDTAILYDQIGPYLLTVDKTNHVILKRVELGSVEQGERAILKGLDAQDDVIVNGVQNATPGSQVAPIREKNSQ